MDEGKTINRPYRKKTGRLMKVNCKRSERRRSRDIFWGTTHISMEGMSKRIEIRLSRHSISESSFKHGISRIASTSANYIVTTLDVSMLAYGKSHFQLQALCRFQDCSPSGRGGRPVPFNCVGL